MSDWAAIEFSAVVFRFRRSGALPAGKAERALNSFAEWRQSKFERMLLSGSAGSAGIELALDEKLMLSAGDALHLALAMESGYRLITFDNRLAAAARTKNVPVLVPSDD